MIMILLVTIITGFVTLYYQRGKQPAFSLALRSNPRVGYARLTSIMNITVGVELRQFPLQSAPEKLDLDATSNLGFNPAIPCYVAVDNCSDSVGVFNATIQDCCAFHNALSYYDLYPGNGTPASCQHCPVCYTSTTNCTQATTGTVPYVPGDCCVAMNGVSYSDGSQCNSCPAMCYTSISDCSGGSTSNATPSSLSDCCNSLSGVSYREAGVCTRCPVSLVAQDPHFLLPLTNGDRLCFNIQGEPDFPFSLISDKLVQLNGVFVSPAEDESVNISPGASFLGMLGIVLQSSVTATRKANIIRVFAQDRSVVVGESTTVTIANNEQVNLNVTEVATISVSTVSSLDAKDEFAWLKVYTQLGFSITIRFYKKHLDLFITDASGLTKEAHGLIGQFLTVDVQIDYDNMLMKLGDRPPISVKRGSAWPFLGVPDDCWYGDTSDDQGAGVIDGVYTDYIVEHLYSTMTSSCCNK